MSWLSADSTGTKEPFHAEGAAAFFNTIECEAVTAKLAGIKTFGKLASQQDSEVETLGKGFVTRSPNGHRWRILISNLGVLSAVDLDA